MDKNLLLRKIPSVDKILKSKEISNFLAHHSQAFITETVRDVLTSLRKKIKEGLISEIDEEKVLDEIKAALKQGEKYSLKPVINATGVVIHTNLGRSLLPEQALRHVIEIATSYSNLEYDLEKGQRGKRYTHIIDAVKKVVNVESVLVVNNNAGAVFLALNSLARGKEVIVSRGELVEIGGSFRIPDVMSNSGAILREVGTTNKTRLSDYENAINENTAMLLKVHRSNFRIIGFTEEATVEELVKLGEKHGIPVMFDLGSGSFINLKKYGFYEEPSVQEVLNLGVHLVTFSGDKLLGSAQAGFILGKAALIEKISRNPLMRALRVDKMTLAALEASLRLYLNEEEAIEKIPTLRMILENPDSIRKRATKILRAFKKQGINAEMKEDISMPGGGSLPEFGVKTYAVAVKPPDSAQSFVKKLRQTQPPVIARVRDDLVIFDARTVQEKEIQMLANAVKQAFMYESS